MTRKCFYIGMRIALVKSRSTSGASHQPAFMGSCLTIGSVYTVVDEFSSHISLFLMIGLACGSVDLFFTWYGFTHRDFIVFQGMGTEFKYKIILYFLKEVKCKQAFTTGI